MVNGLEVYSNWEYLGVGLRVKGKGRNPILFVVDELVVRIVLYLEFRIYPGEDLLVYVVDLGIYPGPGELLKRFVRVILLEVLELEVLPLRLLPPVGGNGENVHREVEAPWAEEPVLLVVALSEDVLLTNPRILDYVWRGSWL